MGPVLQFLASLVDSLIWPAVVVILVIMFRARIGALIDNIVSIRVGDKQVAFARSLGAAEQQAEIVASDTFAQSVSPDSDQASRALRRAWESTVLNPRAAIIEAWLVVEDELHAATDRLGLADTLIGRRTAVRSLPLLQSNGHLDDDWVGLLRHLRHLRNEAAHYLHFDISPEQANEYVDLCLSVVRHTQAIGSE